MLRVGRLALATVYPDDYAKVLSGWHSQTDKTLCELEQDRFAINNTELTELMLGDWKLPKATVDAVHWHETPQHAGREAVPAQLARILHLAAQFGAICVAPEEERYDLARELVDRGHELDLSGPGLFKLGDDIVRDWKEWSKLLELTPLEAPSFKELAEPRPTTIVDLEAAPSSETSILIVDPGDADRRRLAEHLGTSGRRVLQAENGRAALQVALEEQPSIIITEWRLPEMDGPTLCRALRQNKTGQRMRILMLTAQTGDEQELAAVAAGADAFLAKPFRPKLLEARLLAMQRLIDFNLELEREREENRRIAAELAIANGKLQQAAYTDALTELPNRRFGWERLQQAWQDEPAAPLACLLIDVDHFKRVNDTFGHDVGDAVLQRTAAALRGSARREEALCRWGGEEFFLLCPGATLEGAKKAAERLRGAVAAIRTDKAGAAITTTVSIGVAARQEAMERPDQLVKAADQAVYVAKQAGRNRVSP
ncbi:MAG: diguanylate cyclase [Gemmataceae bacterium]